VFIAFRCAPDDPGIGAVFQTMFFVPTVEAVFPFLKNTEKNHTDKPWLEARQTQPCTL
jgi:hypothetical protein